MPGPAKRAHRPVRCSALLGALMLVAASSLAACEPAPTHNIVVIVTDDQSLAQLAWMPATSALVGAAGTTFTHAVVSHSECCPARASMLTGQYSHNHGVQSGLGPTGGVTPFDASRSLAVSLDRLGYRNAFVGKYFNGYGTDSPADVPPGWDDWHALVSPTIYQNYGWTVNDNGSLVTAGTSAADYQTDAMADRAEQALRDAAGDDPFMLWFAPVSPHVTRRTGTTGPAFPIQAPRHVGDLTGQVAVPHTPAFNEADVSDKPEPIRSAPPLTDAQVGNYDNWYRVEAEALLSVDEAVARLIGTLDELGELDDTIIVFTSDNALMHYEHRVALAKVLPYQDSIRVPLLIRGPGFPAGTVVDQYVTNIDLTPTLLGIVGGASTRLMDGVDLRPAVGDPTWNPDRLVLLESGPILGRVTYSGVLGQDWKYVEYSDGQRELYDLRNDPYELDNRVEDPAYDEAEAVLVSRLAELRDCEWDSCRAPAVGAPPPPHEAPPPA